MQARPLLDTASLWLQTSFRKQARPLLSTASLSLAALWRFGAVPLLEALTLLDALALLEALPLWRFVVLRRLGALRLFDASWRSGNTAAMNTGDGACVSELAALRLQRSMAVATQRRWTQEAAHESQSLRLGGFAALRLARSMAALRLCGFAACAFHGSFAALRLARSMAALRLCGLRVPWRLCGFDAFQGARVYPNPRAMWYYCIMIKHTDPRVLCVGWVICEWQILCACVSHAKGCATLRFPKRKNKTHGN